MMGVNPEKKGWPDCNTLKLPVVVHPFTARGNGINRVPVLNDLAIGDTKKVIKRDMFPIEVTFAY